MKLNAGCGSPRGQYKREPWINVDCYSGIRGQRFSRADMLHLPFRDGTFDTIHSIHSFEHVLRPYQIPILQELYRVLELGGELFIEVPNLEGTVRRLVNALDTGNRQVAHNMTASLYGKQRYKGDQHCWSFTPVTLAEKLFEAERWLDVQVESEMISDHHRSEPVVLIRATR